MSSSAPYPQQGATNLPEKPCALGATGRPAPVIEAVRKPLHNPTPVGDRQAMNEIQQHDGQRIGQPVGRQFGRRARHRLGKG